MTFAAVLLQALSMALFALGALTFTALVKGCFYLRRAARERLRLDPGGTVAVAAGSFDFDPGGAAGCVPRIAKFVRRLLNVQYSTHQVVVVLRGSCAPPAASLDRRVSRTRFQAVAGAGSTCGAGDGCPEGRRGGGGGGIDRLGGPRERVRSRLIFAFGGADVEDPSTSAVWSWSPMKPSNRWFGRYAALESLRHWLTRCVTRVPVSGSAILIRKEELWKAGGFDDWPKAVFQRLKGRIAFAPGTSYRLTRRDRGRS